MLTAALLLLATASPQGKVILAERFEVSGDAIEAEAAKLRDAALRSLADQGYQVVRSEERGEAKQSAAGAGPKPKAAELILSAMVEKKDAGLVVNAQLARTETRTLLAGVRVWCRDDLAACGKDLAEQLGSKLREETGVRVKLGAPPR